MLSSAVFRGRWGCWVVKVGAGWADTTGLGHRMIPEGMLLLGHASR